MNVATEEFYSIPPTYSKHSVVLYKKAAVKSSIKTLTCSVTPVREREVCSPRLQVSFMTYILTYPIIQMRCKEQPSIQYTFRFNGLRYRLGIHLN